MKLCHLVLGSTIAAIVVCSVAAQTPVLGNIEAPFPSVQSTVHIAGGVYGPGAVPYGPVGTPLVLSGSDFGATGTVKFVGYKNGVVDSGTTVQATVTLWTPAMLFLTVPSGAVSGLIEVTSAGQTSIGLPFLVTPGAYAGSCPAFPSQNQLQITTASLDDGLAGQSYSVTLGATGGTQSYTWSIASGTLPSGLSLNASTGVIWGTPTGAYGPANLAVQVADSSSPQKTNEAVLSLKIGASSSPSVIYSYCISASPSSSCASPSGGYDHAGNVLSYYDSVTGTWSMANGYDSLNRLTAAQATAGSAFGGLQASWSYDNFGNRTGESFSGTDTGNAPVPPNTNAAYDANNQVWSVVGGLPPRYDAAGNILCDSYNQSTQQCSGPNQYLYDADGRICAVQNLLTGGGMTGYLYDAEGTRVAKGTINSWSCNTTTNGFAITTSYILGPGNEQLTELAWSGGVPSPAHTNVWAAGQLAATYSNADPDDEPSGILYFHLSDWLGTRRVLTDSDGNQAETCSLLPFGDGGTGESCTPLPTEHLLAGKERDNESGNDYFGARYYGSSMGRFMSPDSRGDDTIPVPLPYADFKNPQSLNLYAYVLNNPLSNVDTDGHDVTICANGQTSNCPTISDDQWKQIQQQIAAGNSGGVTVDGKGFMGTGTIMCGGSACGTASYHEAGLIDESGGQLVGIALGGYVAKAIGAAWGAVAGFFGRGAGEVAGEAVGTAASAGGKVLLNAGTKQEAKAVVQAMADGAQKQAAERVLARAGNNATVSISQADSGLIRVEVTRPGFDGTQTMTKAIDSSGNTTTVQSAHDASGSLVHYDPK